MDRSRARESARRCRLCRLAPAAILAVLAAALASPGAALAQPVPGPPKVIDGPSSSIIALTGMSIARDGTGGLVYLKDLGGAAHVYVSQLNGTFQSPQQVDAGLSGASSQPVIAAGNAGLLIVAFISGGNLYVVDRATSASPYSAPTIVASGASNPAIAITDLGKAYLAFTVNDGSGHDVRCAYYDNGTWGLESTPLNAVPADSAGIGTGRPSVAAAGDGVGIVGWGEAGHIYTRRVWGTGPSVVYEQADVPSVNGWNEVQADEPALAVGGDSSYVIVAWHELLASGSQQQSRVLMARLRGSAYDPMAPADGLTTPGGEGAVQPAASASEYGEGLITDARDTTHQLWAMTVGQNAAPGGTLQIDSGPNEAEPYAVPTATGLHSGLIAWQQTPLTGSPEINVRFEYAGAFANAETVSSPSMGPTDAAAGLVDAGDISTDVAAAWVQGTSSSRSIVADQMYSPPGSFSATTSFQYARTTTPVLAWSPSRDAWGPITYTVTIDGQQIGQTQGTSIGPPNVGYPVPLTQGPHTWQVTAANGAGLTSTARAATVFVDTVPPQITALRLTGKRVAGAPVHLYVLPTDPPNGLSAADASGIASVKVKWGDRKHNRLHTHGKYHVYRKPGRYTITVIVTDKAGNVTKQKLVIQIKRPPKRHRRHRHG